MEKASVGAVHSLWHKQTPVYDFQWLWESFLEPDISGGVLPALAPVPAIFRWKCVELALN